ncbi:MAG: hypothetical protein V8Q75_04815 [Bacilli bacterium]
MKIVNLDENCMTIFLNKLYLKELNFDVREDLEDYFKELFLKLKKYYMINISGYYNIDVYIDNDYGLVINLNKENIEYYDYFDNQIDMRISLKDSKFLYGIDDPLSLPAFAEGNIYIYKDKYYVDFNDIIDNVTMMYLLEFSDIIFDEQIDIIRHSQKLKR